VIGAVHDRPVDGTYKSFVLVSASVRTVVFLHDHPDGDGFDPDAAETSRRDIKLSATPPAGPFAAVGWRFGGLTAAALAATLPSRVDRLVLCCVPAPIDAPPDFDPGNITAKTLLLFGQADPDAPAAHARWWKEHIRDARIEMVPRASSDIIDVLWKRVLSHAAPKTLRR
jgi:pimeloyl-ACP methyl ester carboxylesterase